MQDIYFTKAYAQVHASVERGQAEYWELDCPFGRIGYSFIKRKVETALGDDYYDITSPYGYGGPLILECQDKDQLLMTFESEFGVYCKTENIVSEFVRFHPICENAKTFEAIYQPQYLRQTVGTTISNPGERPFMAEFNQSSRKLTRRAEKMGVTARIVEQPSFEDLQNFISLYYATMDRNGATDFYYFSEQYFKECVYLLGKNLLLIEVVAEEKVICACIYFVSGAYLHEHLMGSLTESLALNPVYVLKKAASDWAYDKEMELIHYGGGLTNAPDDPLFSFKKKFTRQTFFDFYIGKRIHKEDAYQALCRERYLSPTDPFFPAYRKNTT